MAYRQPAAVDPPTVTALDINGMPLVVNGIPVDFEHVDCGVAPCPPDSQFPPPAGQVWVYYRSTQLLKPTDDTLRFHLDYHWDEGGAGGTPPNCSLLQGQVVGHWVSDDRDDLYGATVTDLYEEDRFSLNLPGVSAWAASVLILALVGQGAWMLARRRRGMAA